MDVEQYLNRIYDKVEKIDDKVDCIDKNVTASNVHLANHSKTLADQEKRLLILEAYKNKTIGFSAAAGAILGAIGGAIVKYLF